MILLEEYMQKPFLNSIKKKTGFTLAEVLVTLAIIGVVAALTIPNLIQNTKNAQTVTALKKAYSTFSQAYTSIIADGTTMDALFKEDILTVFNEFAAKLNVTKNCGTTGGCFPDVDYLNLKGDPIGNENSWGTPSAILADGTSVDLSSMGLGGCNMDYGGGAPLVCGMLAVDINGFKGPNQMGRDLFAFYITTTGIVPAGSYSGDDIYGDCVAGDAGLSCAYTVLTSGAINY